MATIMERKGRFTAQIRRRGMPSVSRTFRSQEEAKSWSEKTEANLLDLVFNAETDLSEIAESSLQSCGVYFLFKRSQCVYVGQSLNVHRRIKDHRSRIDFDIYTWTPVHSSQLQIVELMYISAIQPVHNSAHIRRGGLHGPTS